ncbi:MAG: hypothetical protein V1867_03410 [Candidatus Falkowbacteria bacterium]
MVKNLKIIFIITFAVFLIFISAIGLLSSPKEELVRPASVETFDDKYKGIIYRRYTNDYFKIQFDFYDEKNALKFYESEFGISIWNKSSLAYPLATKPEAEIKFYDYPKKKSLYEFIHSKYGHPDQTAKLIDINDELRDDMPTFKVWYQEGGRADRLAFYVDLDWSDTKVNRQIMEIYCNNNEFCHELVVSLKYLNINSSAANYLQVNQKVESAKECDEKYLKITSDTINNIASGSKNVMTEGVFKDYLSCFYGNLPTRTEVKDFNNDGQKEIIVFFGSDKRGVYLMSALSYYNDYFRPVKFIDIQNKKGASKEILPVPSSIVAKEVVYDFDDDGIFEVIGAGGNVYSFQDNEFIRFNNIDFSPVNSREGKKYGWYWDNSSHASSPDKKHVAWTVHDDGNGGGPAIIIYTVETGKFQSLYPGIMELKDSGLESYLIDFLRWIDNDSFIFIKKACGHPGCDYEIRKLSVSSGDVENLRMVYDGSFENNDDTDDDIIRYSADCIVSEEIRRMKKECPEYGDTDCWKIYRDEAYGFYGKKFGIEIKYPPDWKINADYETSFFPPKEKNNTYDAAIVNPGFTLYQLPIDTSLADYFLKQKQVVNFNHVNIRDYEVYESFENGSSGQAYVLTFGKNENIIRLAFRGKTKFDDLSPVEKKIVDSFDFIEMGQERVCDEKF